MGFLRLFLALAVVAGHTSSTVFRIPMPGAFDAVNFFFIISGFYMSMVLNTKYKNVSVKTFYLSRILRIFPMYFVGLLLMILINFYNIKNFFDTLTLTSKSFFIVTNTAIFGQDLPYTFCLSTQGPTCASPSGMTINPPAWSLAIELSFYLLAPLLVKNSKLLICYLTTGLLYSISITYVDVPTVNEIYNITSVFSLNYFFYPSSFIFFGLGVIAYRLDESLMRFDLKYAIPFVLLLIQTNTNMSFWLPIFLAFALPVVFKISRKSRMDRLIGEISYPVYILHFPIIVLFSKFDNFESYSFLNWATLGDLVSIFSIILALVFSRLVEKPVNALRASIFQKDMET